MDLRDGDVAEVGVLRTRTYVARSLSACRLSQSKLQLPPALAEIAETYLKVPSGCSPALMDGVSTRGRETKLEREGKGSRVASLAHRSTSPHRKHCQMEYDRSENNEDGGLVSAYDWYSQTWSTSSNAGDEPLTRLTLARVHATS